MQAAGYNGFCRLFFYPNKHMMTPSNILIEALKRFEGFRPKAYRCPAGVWTIGYGHTDGVRSGQLITREEADRVLRADAAKAAAAVAELGVVETQGQLDALTDFVFNLGVAALRSSTLLRVIRANADERCVRREFMRWVYAGGRPLRGLAKRRAWEADRFFS